MRRKHGLQKSRARAAGGLQPRRTLAPGPARLQWAAHQPSWPNWPPGERAKARGEAAPQVRARLACQGPQQADKCPSPHRAPPLLTHTTGTSRCDGAGGAAAQRRMGMAPQCWEVAAGRMASPARPAPSVGPPAAASERGGHRQAGRWQRSAPPRPPNAPSQLQQGAWYRQQALAAAASAVRRRTWARRRSRRRRRRSSAQSAQSAAHVLPEQPVCSGSRPAAAVVSCSGGGPDAAGSMGRVCLPCPLVSPPALLCCSLSFSVCRGQGAAMAKSK